MDKRECCLQEIRQTEEKYSDTLQSILQVGTSPPPDKRRSAWRKSLAQAHKKSMHDGRVTPMTSVFAQHFMKPLQRFLQAPDLESIFINIVVRDPAA